MTQQFGHQNDVSRSVSGKELDDVKDVTGSVSGIFGIDSLGLFGSEAVVIRNPEGAVSGSTFF